MTWTTKFRFRPMGLPRNHHFIPAFFLKQWALTDDKLVEYSIKHHKLIAKWVGPEATGFEFDLYAFPELSPEEAQFIEQKFFDYADRVACDSLNLHLTSNVFSDWTVELRSGWSRFVVALHLRHPDAMPELKAAAQSVWQGSGIAYQQQYEEIKKPEDPPTYDEYLAQRDPLTPVKARVNQIIKTFDNETLGLHINNMAWAVLDLRNASTRLLMSDRPVVFFNLKQPEGYVALAIGPTKIFLGVNNKATLDTFRHMKPELIVRLANKYAVTRARKYVWAMDESQTRFVANNISKAMEPLPFFPNIGWKG